MQEVLRQIRELNERLATWTIDSETYERILDCLPDGVLVINQAAEIRFINQAIESMFGYQRADLLGRPVHVLLDPALAEVHAAHLATFFADPSPRPMGAARHFDGRKSDGTSVRVQISIAPVGPLAVAVVRRVIDGQ